MASLVRRGSRWKRRSILPGFGLTLGLSLSYLGLIVLIPLSLLFWRASGLPWEQWGEIVASPRAMAAYRLSFGASAAAAGMNTLCGFLVAWVLVRYPFPGRGLIDALVDLPFALPTAVAGISLATLYSQQGWLGKYLAMAGIQGAYSRLGVVIALTFIGLPFVVADAATRAARPGPEVEEAAASLGASRWQTFRRVLFRRFFPRR
jgi:sulfate transport system permease protein